MSKSISSLLKAVKAKFLGLGLNAKSWIQKGGTVPIEVFPIDLLEKEKLINAPLRSGEIVMSKKEYEVKLKKKTVKTFTKTFWCKNCNKETTKRFPLGIEISQSRLVGDSTCLAEETELRCDLCIVGSLF